MPIKQCLMECGVFLLLFKSLLLAFSTHIFTGVFLHVVASRPHIVMIVADDLVRIVYLLTS